MRKGWDCDYDKQNTSGTWVHPTFCWVHYAQSLVLCRVFCRLLFVFLSVSLCHILSVLLRFKDSDYSFQQYFSYIMATSFSGGRSRSTRREPPNMGKQLLNFITYGCESSAPFCNLKSRVRTHAVHVYSLEKYFKKSLPFFFVFTVLMFSLKVRACVAQWIR
jgi:hypothetical protein